MKWSIPALSLMFGCGVMVGIAAGPTQPVKSCDVLKPCGCTALSDKRGNNGAKYRGRFSSEVSCHSRYPGWDQTAGSFGIEEERLRFGRLRPCVERRLHHVFDASCTQRSNPRREDALANPHTCLV